MLAQSVRTFNLRRTESLPRTTERPARECGDEPRTISAQTPNTIVRGECSKCSQRAAPESHGRKSVVRGLPNSLMFCFCGSELRLVLDRAAQSNARLSS